MTPKEAHTKKMRLLLRLSLTLGLTLILLSSAAAAAVLTIEQPEKILNAGETATLPVTLEYAEDIAGFQFYLKETSGASIRIDPSSAAIEGLCFNTENNKAVLYPEEHEPLYGTVRLFDIIATPAAGKNIDLSFDIVEVIDSANNDITSSCIGVPALIRVTDGITVARPPETTTKGSNIRWIYDPEHGIFPDDFNNVPPAAGETTAEPTPAKPVITEPTPVKPAITEPTPAKPTSQPPVPAAQQETSDGILEYLSKTFFSVIDAVAAVFFPR